MTRTLENLNLAAKPFLRRAEFIGVNGGQLKLFLPVEFYPKGPRYFAAILKGQRTWFRHNAIPRHLGLGGTDEQTLCQLILWYRDQPRLPGRVLKYWQERNVGFGAVLDQIGYDDPKSLTCVLCGKSPDGLDWWSLGNVTGPSCLYGRCREVRA